MAFTEKYPELTRFFIEIGEFPTLGHRLKTNFRLREKSMCATRVTCISSRRWASDRQVILRATQNTRLANLTL